MRKASYLVPKSLSKLSVLAAVSVLLAGSQAHALISGGVSIGKEWTEQKSGDDKGGIAGNQVRLNAMINPIPFVPVAAGLGLRNTSYTKGLADGVNASVRTISLEVMGWLPMVPVITPYISLGYDVYGLFTTKAKINGFGDATLLEKVSGSRIAIGFELPVLPLISLTFEGSLSTEKSKFESLTLPSGVTKEDLGAFDDSDLSSKALLVGAKVSL